MKKIEKSLQVLLRLIMNPLTGFIAYLCIMVYIVFAPKSGPNIIILFLVLPWFILVLIAFNMPFISLALRGLKLSEEIKKNHALEHGTLFFLRREYASNRRAGGMARSDGFRISGVQKKEEILKSFDMLIKELKRGKSEIVVSLTCGTNRATAQGFGIILLSIAAVLLLGFSANPAISIAVFGFVSILYFILRGRLGNWVQDRFYISYDFSHASIHSINKVDKERFWERNPVFYVKTQIS